MTMKTTHENPTAKRTLCCDFMLKHLYHLIVSGANNNVLSTYTTWAAYLLFYVTFFMSISFILYVTSVSMVVSSIVYTLLCRLSAPKMRCGSRIHNLFHYFSSRPHLRLNNKRKLNKLILMDRRCWWRIQKILFSIFEIDYTINSNIKHFISNKRETINQCICSIVEAIKLNELQHFAQTKRLTFHIVWHSKCGAFNWTCSILHSPFFLVRISARDNWMPEN